MPSGVSGSTPITARDLVAQQDQREVVDEQERRPHARSRLGRAIPACLESGKDGAR